MFSVKVCPHAGGVGLCEMVQHLQMWDYVALSGSKEGRMIEYVDEHHEHFEDPLIIRDACYMPPKVRETNIINQMCICWFIEILRIFLYIFIINYDHIYN